MSTLVQSSPYAWPWDGRLLPGNTALLAISSPGAGPGPATGTSVHDGVTPAGTTGRLGDFASQVEGAGVLVVHVMTAPSAALVGRSGQVGSSLDPMPPEHLGLPAGAVVVGSDGVDGFYGSNLDSLLRRHRRTHLLLAGTWLETGVHSTMRSANDRGYECLLLSDLSSAAEPDLLAGAISSIEMSGGIFGAVATSADYLAALGGLEPAAPTPLQGETS